MKTYKCEACAGQVSDSDKFCPSCGGQLSDSNLSDSITVEPSIRKNVIALLKDIGLGTIVNVPTDLPEAGKWSPAITTQIPLASLGAIRSIFKEVNLKYAFGLEIKEDYSQVVWVNLAYKYKHSAGGSNGYGVRYSVSSKLTKLEGEASNVD